MRALPVSTPSVSYSMAVRLEVPAAGDAVVSRLTATMEALGGSVTAFDVVSSDADPLGIDVTIAATPAVHADEIVEQQRASRASPSARSPTVRS
jgi:malate dehydrogenase (oxaloacetate-decarboxylating)